MLNGVFVVYGFRKGRLARMTIVGTGRNLTVTPQYMASLESKTCVSGDGAQEAVGCG